MWNDIYLVLKVEVIFKLNKFEGETICAITQKKKEKCSPNRMTHAPLPGKANVTITLIFCYMVIC